MILKKHYKREVIKRDKFKCTKCQKSVEDEILYVVYTGPDWDSEDHEITYDSFTTLCHKCKVEEASEIDYDAHYEQQNHFIEYLKEKIEKGKEDEE